MRVIDDAVERVSSIIVEVANASSEQAEGIRQVNQAVSHLDGATQQNATLVEQAAATAQRLAEQADVLDEAVRLFTVPDAVAEAVAGAAASATPGRAGARPAHARKPTQAAPATGTVRPMQRTKRESGHLSEHEEATLI